MRTGIFNSKLLFCTFILFVLGGWISVHAEPAKDEATQKEMESQKLLQLMKNAPPAPMPKSATTHTETESSSPDSRSTVSYDPVTGKEIVGPAISPSGSKRTNGAAAKAPVQTKKDDNDSN
jgi:hypothetical protein